MCTRTSDKLEDQLSRIAKQNVASKQLSVSSFAFACILKELGGERSEEESYGFKGPCCLIINGHA